jgi:hypothetical protein
MSHNSAASAFCLLPRALRGAYDDAGGGSDDTGWFLSGRPVTRVTSTERPRAK